MLLRTSFELAEELSDVGGCGFHRNSVIYSGLRDQPSDLAELHALYLQSHGKIEGRAHNRFSRLHGDERDEAVAETVAIAYQNYHRLFRQGREITDSLRGGTAAFAAKQVASGGRLVGQQPVKDVMSPARRHGHNLGAPRDYEAMDHDRPAEQAALNVDLAAWLATLDDTLRAVALLLKEGKTNEQVGAEFGFGRGWASLRRQELRASWSEFFGEEV